MMSGGADNTSASSFTSRTVGFQATRLQLIEAIPGLSLPSDRGFPSDLGFGLCEAFSSRGCSPLELGFAIETLTGAPPDASCVPLRASTAALACSAVLTSTKQ